MFNIEENLKQLPDSPGVYLHKDDEGDIIYVGKASSLKNRVRQYFRPRGQDAKTAALASHISEFEYIVTKTEAEALLLENTLIKRHRPRYNVMLRDDKTYPYIKITFGERWPRIIKTRIVKADGSKYFGPYADVSAVNRIIALLNDVYRLKRCKYKSFPKNHRPCLQGHIDRCRSMCAYSGNMNNAEYKTLHGEYMNDIARIVSFLKGNGKEIEKYIAAHMNEASEKMEYEEAARWRDYLESARSVTEKQRVELLSSGSMDVVLASGEFTVTVFFVRDGKLIGRERHKLDAGEEGSSTGSDIISAFISQYYSNRSKPPSEILLDAHIADEALIADALTESTGYKVKIIVPMRGAKRELVNLAQNDVDDTRRRDEQRAAAEEKRRVRLLEQLADVFGDTLPSGAYLLRQAGGQALLPRIEAYDISHTGGVDSVGAMVVFSGDTPEKSAYRRFRLKGDYAGDDYSAMQEVLYRRLKRAMDGDKSFLPLPDIVLIDGGKGHVSAARQIIDAMEKVRNSARDRGTRNLSHADGCDKLHVPLSRDSEQEHLIHLAGMVKDNSHRTRGLVVETSEYDKGDTGDGSASVKEASADVRFVDPQPMRDKLHACPPALAPEDVPQRVYPEGHASDGTPPQPTNTADVAADAKYTEIDLTEQKDLYRLIGSVQEEVHRFAIEYHRKRRDRTMLGKKENTI